MLLDENGRLSLRHDRIIECVAKQLIYRDTKFDYRERRGNYRCLSQSIYRLEATGFVKLTYEGGVFLTDKGVKYYSKFLHPDVKSADKPASLFSETQPKG